MALLHSIRFGNGRIHIPHRKYPYKKVYCILLIGFCKTFQGHGDNYAFAKGFPRNWYPGHANCVHVLRSCPRNRRHYFYSIYLHTLQLYSGVYQQEKIQHKSIFNMQLLVM